MSPSQITNELDSMTLVSANIQRSMFLKNETVNFMKGEIFSFLHLIINMELSCSLK